MSTFLYGSCVWEINNEQKPWLVVTIFTKIKKSAFLTGKSADFFVTVYLVARRSFSEQKAALRIETDKRII